MLGTSACAYSVASENDMAKEVGRKDFLSAQVKIAQDDQVEKAHCATYAGPAARACQIQTQAKRQAAEEEAGESLERAGSEPPLRPENKKRAAEAALVKARLARSQAFERNKVIDRAAHHECSKLSYEARRSCNKDVQGRTHEAQDQIEYRYRRDVKRAKALAR